ncbi:unnamed protein product [Allacma fusca]|uniref:Uncharacterized protein n=1 Tax=Allacma fusca TaxID=39272 RepID=A0A8J2K6T3_9HEXA|nr:unnamed protein product [Allacma fusca]
MRGPDEGKGMVEIFNFSLKAVQDPQVISSFTDILDSLCEKFLYQNVSAILYLTNTELYGRSTAASQYFLQLAGYLGIPVIAWNADNSGLLRGEATQRTMQPRTL